MTTTTRNEAAERLYRAIRDLDDLDKDLADTADSDVLAGLVAEALAAERRATIERIRTALLLNEGLDIPEDYARRALDEEAAR